MLPESSAFGIAIFGTILFLGVIISRISEKIKFPSIILFILLGILIGPYGLKIEGRPIITAEEIPIGIQSIVGVALAFVLFNAGFLMRWQNLREALLRATRLVTIGLGITIILLAVCIFYLLRIDFIYAFLLAVIIGSTDPFAIFSLTPKLRPTVAKALEAETVLNDSIVILLTFTILSSLYRVGPPLTKFLISILTAILIGIISSFSCSYLIKRFRIDRNSPMFLIGFTIFIYAITELAGGNGILSCFIFGLILSNIKLPYTRNIKIVQKQINAIIMVIIFTLMGILLNIQQLTHIDWMNGIIISFFLIFLIRPVSVLVSLFKDKLTLDEKMRIGLIGPRGIVSAALALQVGSSGLLYVSKIVDITFVVIITTILVDSLIFLAIKRKKAKS